MKKMTARQQKFVKLCEKDDLGINYDYSGRGMYGRTCPSVNVDELSEVSFNPQKYAIDNMGMGYVIYCP